MTNILVTSAVIRFAAMNLLSLREHSAKELYKKLTQKFQQEDGVTEVIQSLTAEGLQSDTRFTEAFINMRKRQGKGPLVIAMELKERGIVDELAHRFLESNNDSWGLLAVTVRRKKFGQSLPQDAKQKAKQIRFLSGRGFSSSNIRDALNYTDEYDE